MSALLPAAWWLRLRRTAAGMALGVWTVLAAGHAMPESQLWIDATPTGLTATLQSPLVALEIGYGQPLAQAADQVLAQHGDSLSRYFQQHVHVHSGTQAWSMQAPQLRVIGTGTTAELEAVLVMQAPPGVNTRAFTLVWEAITHELRTHRVAVFLRNDWASGQLGMVPYPLGDIHYRDTTVDVALPPPAAGASVKRLLRMGAEHIGEGNDHLLFLLLLVMVAPLTTQAGRWGQARPMAAAARSLAWVVTAFTVGHSVTLALGSTGVLTPPARPVEVAVAASIAVAALHALRPLPGHSAFGMALGFGLIHGFAFASSLSGAGLTVWQHAQALLAFNLGIEAMQLVLLTATLPALLVLGRARPDAYQHLRRAVAVAALGLSLFWAVERLQAPAGQPGTPRESTMGVDTRTDDAPLLALH